MSRIEVSQRRFFSLSRVEERKRHGRCNFETRLDGGRKCDWFDKEAGEWQGVG